MLNLVTVVGRNTHLLPHMLKHYEGMVDKIYVGVYQQSGDDDILNQVRDLGIEPFTVFSDNKYNWNRVTEIYNTIKATKPNDWWIVSDDDELQVYPRDINEIIKDCESGGFTFVTGGFLDRIGKDGSFPIVDSTTDIQKAFPLAGFFRYPLSGACPNKVTLCKGSQKISSGQHYAEFTNSKNSWGRWHKLRMPIDDVFTQVHHFKWDSSCKERIKEVSETVKDYSWWWEYKKLYDNLDKTNWKVDISNSEFYIEDINPVDGVNYSSYSQWDKLRNIIVNI